MRLVRFLLSGSAAAAGEYAVFLSLNHAGLPLIATNSCSFAAGLLVSFLLNRRWVFKSSGKRHKEFMAYLILAFINLFISNGLVYSGVHLLEVSLPMSKLVSMLIIAGWNYYIFPKVVFRDREVTPTRIGE